MLVLKLRHQNTNAFGIRRAEFMTNVIQSHDFGRRFQNDISALFLARPDESVGRREVLNLIPDFGKTAVEIPLR